MVVEKAETDESTELSDSPLAFSLLQNMVRGNRVGTYIKVEAFMRSS